MTTQDLFVRANQELKKVIDQIKDDQWELAMPAGLTSKPANLLTTINYHIYDDAWVPDVLSGKTKEEVGDIYDHLLSTEDTKADYAKYNALAIAAVEPFTELEKITHLSYGDFSAKDYLQHITIFRGLRVYDLAKLIGSSTDMAEDIVQGMWDQYLPLVDGYRQYGILPPALPMDSNTGLQAKFLALVGRE